MYGRSQQSATFIPLCAQGRHGPTDYHCVPAIVNITPIKWTTEYYVQSPKVVRSDDIT